MARRMNKNSKTDRSPWRIPLDELAEKASREGTAFEYGSPRHAEVQALGQILIARAFSAASTSQKHLLWATWVLAGATIALAVATMAMAAS